MATDGGQVQKIKKMSRISIFIRALLLFFAVTAVYLWDIIGMIVVTRVYKISYGQIEYNIGSIILSSAAILYLIWRTFKTRWEGVAIGTFFVFWSFRSFLNYGQQVFYVKGGMLLPNIYEVAGPVTLYIGLIFAGLSLLRHHYEGSNESISFILRKSLWVLLLIGTWANDTHQLGDYVMAFGEVIAAFTLGLIPVCLLYFTMRKRWEGMVWYDWLAVVSLLVNGLVAMLTCKLGRFGIG